MFGENFDWLKDMKVGDEIGVRKGTYLYGYFYDIRKITKVTPSGRIELDDGTKFMPNGKEVGENHSYPLAQVTQEILDMNEMRKLKQKIDFDKYKSYFTLEQLRQIYVWQQEIETRLNNK
jgi:hypothetical protein